MGIKLGIAVAFCVAGFSSSALGVPISITNPSFEDGVDNSPAIPGWTNNVGSAEGFFINADGNLTGLEPNSTSAGSQWVTANRGVGGVLSSGNTPASSTLTQQVDVSSFAAQIDADLASVELLFDHAVGRGDIATVSIDFLDVNADSLGLAIVTPNLPDSPEVGTPDFLTFITGAELNGDVPVGTRFLAIILFAQKAPVGTVLNVAFDNFSGEFTFAEPNIVPEPATWSLIVLGLCGIGFWQRRRR